MNIGYPKALCNVGVVRTHSRTFTAMLNECKSDARDLVQSKFLFSQSSKYDRDDDDVEARAKMVSNKRSIDYSPRRQLSNDIEFFQNTFVSFKPFEVFNLPNIKNYFSFKNTCLLTSEVFLKTSASVYVPNSFRVYSTPKSQLM